jgi:uncharacterized protein YqjF (DUF2071 family)
LGVERLKRSLVSMQPFLTNWRYLAMLNYAVDPRVLAPFVPLGTEIDFENGETFVSVFGLLFLDTRLLVRPGRCQAASRSEEDLPASS